MTLADKFDIEIPKTIKGIPKVPKISFSIEKAMEGQPTAEPKNNIKSHQQLTDDPKVYEIELTVNERFRPGDVFEILPPQNIQKIRNLLQHLGIEDGYFLLNGTTLGLLSSMLSKKDFKVKKSVIRYLSSLDSDGKNILLFLSSVSGRESLSKLCSWDIVDFCIEFNVFPPIEALLELLDDITPRCYSVCRNSNNFIFCFNVAEYGLCTQWMSTLKEGYIPAKKRISKLPPFYKPSGPVIMICNGTGISPFIGMLEELEESGNKDSCTLVYGHRNSTDFLYSNVVTRMVKNGIVELLEAESRPDSNEKKYVQDVIHLLENLFEASVMVCGSAVMGKDLHNKLVEIYRIQTECSQEESIKYWMDRQKAGTYLRDLW